MEHIAETVMVDGNLEAVMLNQNPQTCEICGKPYILKQYSRFRVYVPDCKCRENQEKREAEIKERAKKRAELKRRYKDAGFPYDTRGKRLKTRTCEHTDTAWEYIKKFQPKKRQGLYFVGKVGNGKTTLAVCIGKELILRGYKVKFVGFSQAIRILQSTYGTKNPLEFMEQVREFAKYDLLIFDDFGREAYKDRTLTDVADFVNHIYSEQTNVIITSNPEMVEKIKQIPDFEAMFDRFFQMTKRKNFTRPSYRRIDG